MMIRADGIDADFVARRIPSVASVEIEGEIVLYQTAAETIHVLNPSASVVWKMLDGIEDVEAVSRRLAEEFEIELVLMLEQVSDVIRDFARQGLLADVEPDEDVIEQIRLDLLRSHEVGTEIGDE